MKTAASTVREVLARKLHREAATIDPSLRLQRDLHLRPLELVVLTLDLEEATGVSLSVLKIAALETVGDLAELLSGALAAVRRARHAELIARRFAPTS